VVVFAGCELLNKQPITKQDCCVLISPDSWGNGKFLHGDHYKHTLQSHAHKLADIISSSKSLF